MKEYWAVRAPNGELEGAIRDNEVDAVLAWRVMKIRLAEVPE